MTRLLQEITTTNVSAIKEAFDAANFSYKQIAHEQVSKEKRQDDVREDARKNVKDLANSFKRE